MTSFEGWLLEKMTVRKWLLTLGLGVAAAGGAGLAIGHAWPTKHTEALEVTVKAPSDPMAAAIMDDAKDQADRVERWAKKRDALGQRLGDLYTEFDQAKTPEAKHQVNDEIKKTQAQLDALHP